MRTSTHGVLIFLTAVILLCGTLAEQSADPAPTAIVEEVPISKRGVEIPPNVTVPVTVRSGDVETGELTSLVHLVPKDDEGAAAAVSAAVSTADNSSKDDTVLNASVSLEGVVWQYLDDSGWQDFGGQVTQLLEISYHNAPNKTAEFEMDDSHHTVWRQCWTPRTHALPQ